MIDAHSNKLLGLINDLLDLSRVEVSQTMLHKSEASLNDVVKISTKIAEPLAAQNHVTLRHGSRRDDSHHQLRSAPDQAGVREPAQQRREVQRRGGFGHDLPRGTRSDEVVVSVRDHGPGIDAEDIPELFEKFTQLDGGSSREKDGLGIGLKLVKHYVELHGGRVWVTSEKGAGSTFSFSLPK